MMQTKLMNNFVFYLFVKITGKITKLIDIN